MVGTAPLFQDDDLPLFMPKFPFSSRSLTVRSFVSSEVMMTKGYTVMFIVKIVGFSLQRQNGTAITFEIRAHSRQVVRYPYLYPLVTEPFAHAAGDHYERGLIDGDKPGFS
jgi:hypothetical protein